MFVPILIPPHQGWRRRLILLLLLGACDAGVLPPGVSSADAFRVSHVCADSFQITNRLVRADGPGLQVTVTSWWPKAGSRTPAGSTLHLRVPSATSATAAGVAGFRVGAPAGALIQVNAVPDNAPGYLVTTSMTASNNGPAACPASIPVLVRVRSVRGLGVTGSVSPAADSMPIGSTISWSFTPTGGAERVDVRVNGKEVPAVGSQLIDRETLITAVGATRPSVSPELGPLVTQARALLASPSPQASAQQLLNDLIALLDRVDEATGDRLLNEFQAQAISSDADVDAVLRLDSLLANSVLRVDIPNHPGMREGALVFPSEPTTYFIAAGILTTQQKVAATAKVVRTLIRDRAMLGENDLIRSFVSPTMSGLGKDVRGCVARIFSLSGIRDRVNGFLTWCLPIYGSLLDSNDFLEASSQILRQWFGGVPARHTSMAFMDSVSRYRQMGYHLLIDGHSQGTLIAREAITELANRGSYQPDRDTTCIGVVAMAGPVSGNWPMPLTHFREFATEGDIVADAGGSQASRIPTDLTRQRDSALASVSKLNFPLRLAINIMYGVQLHDLQGVYLGEAPPRNRLLASNEEIRRECEVASVRSSLPGNRVRISKGEELPIGLYFQVFNHNNHQVASRARTITSEQPAIAEMLNNVVVAGRAIGDANVVARSGNMSSTVIVEVRPPPVLGIGGKYSGQWLITNPNMTGALSITLEESGTVTKDGEPQVSGTVTYGHPAGTFTVPMLDGKVAMGGPWPTITFRMATPEFPNPDSWANVSLQVRGSGVLSGGAILYFQGGLVRETRGWEVKVGP